MARLALTEEQKDAVRARLIDAAMRVIADGQKPTLREIGKRTNRDSMTIYTYFTNYDAVQAAIFDRIVSVYAESADLHPQHRTYLLATCPIGHPAAQRWLALESALCKTP